MCHILLTDPKFFSALLLIDQELAQQRQAAGCACGGALHKADYPRKPRGCPVEARPDCASRFSFCCNRCRKRATAQSVRFLGRRLYLALAVVLLSGRRAGQRAAQAQLAQTLAVPARTVARWRRWWLVVFPETPLWQANRARFMPPVAPADLPSGLLARFAGAAPQAMAHLLVFLLPLSVTP